MFFNYLFIIYFIVFFVIIFGDMLNAKLVAAAFNSKRAMRHFLSYWNGCTVFAFHGTKNADALVLRSQSDFLSGD